MPSGGLCRQGFSQAFLADGPDQGNAPGEGLPDHDKTQPSLGPWGLVAFRLDHVAHRVDQGQVCEGLREVTMVAAAARIDFLRVQPQRASGGQQPLAERPSPAMKAV
jgi:hypothetical protein